MTSPPPATTLRAQIDQAPAHTPTLWWLGHAGFAIKYHGIVFYVDPRLDGAEGAASELTNADMVLATHDHPSHLHAGTLPALLDASPRAKLVLPKPAAARANAIGIGNHRLTTTDSGLRVEYFKNGEYVRVYAVPSAHPELEWSPVTGFPYLGYLIRCGRFTIYHSGDCAPYDSLASRLRPFDVTVALLPIDGARNFDIEQAAGLAEAIAARWLAPMHYTDGGERSARFIDHLLFHRPEQRFKVFTPGEGWAVPED